MHLVAGGGLYLVPSVGLLQEMEIRTANYVLTIEDLVLHLARAGLGVVGLGHNKIRCF